MTEKSAVICLSHMLDESNNLSFDSSNRIEKACDIFLNKKSEYLITTGWKYKDEINKPLSKIMAEYAITNFNIPEESIFEVPSAKDTIGEAYFIKKFFCLKNKDINNLFIVTSDWHRPRASEIFNFIFGDVLDPKIFFYSVKGESGLRKKELNNNSILKFRKLKKACSKGNLDEIYSKMLKNHDLYKK